MYLPNQINACRTGFYGSINVEHGNKNKKIKAQNVIDNGL